MSDKPRKLCTALNYIKHFLILAPAVTGSILISTIASLVGITIAITSSAIELTIWAVTAGIKKYKSMIKKNKNKHDKIVFLEKSKLHSIQVSTSKALIDSNISHDEFVLINERRDQKFKDFKSSSKILVNL